MTGRIRTWDEAVRIRRDSRRGIVHSHSMAIAESDRVAETTQEPVDATIGEWAAVSGGMGLILALLIAVTWDMVIKPSL
jgi:hypothetical protein